MARRRRRKKHPVLKTLLVLLMATAVTATGIATRIYMAHTGEPFSVALRHTGHVIGDFVLNLVSPPGHSIPVNPYRETDYYLRGTLKHCAASEVSRAGIDVSSHQQEIDWQAVAQAGVEFAMVRVGYRGYTDGDIFADTCARQNIEGALAAGLDVGIYFFSQAITEQEALEEAWFVLDSIDGMQITYPVMFDWEGVAAEARTDHVTGAELTRFADVFCAEIERAGYTAGVYFNQSYGYNRLDLRSLRDYEFWLAEYADAQSFAYAVQMWQYDPYGQIPGIGGNVDLNLCYRDYLNPKEDLE